MILNKIQIKNFRSIKEETITFGHNFQILVGINESGKSNILRAISLLNKEIEITKDDIRDSTSDEEIIDDAYVRFLFKINEEFSKKLVDSINKITLSEDISKPIFKQNDKELSIVEFCREKKEFLFIANILTQEKYFSNWSILSYNKKILPNWKEVISNEPYTPKGGKEINLEPYLLVDINYFPDLPQENFKDISFERFNKIINDEIIKVAEEFIPKCIVWKYEEKNLLPGRISLGEFKVDPSTCIPLKNMFSLAGFNNISKSIDDAQAKSNGIRNMFRRISDVTTSLMKRVWPEWKKIKITLNQNGTFIEAGIEDECNFYSLQRRSDGFKRFLTFLLFISAQNKTEEIYSNIIVIDEPDIGLHPSGIKYLRNELKKISENNIVFICTHSIFMIDKDIIDRHLIVEKKREITHIKRVESSNINDEEVIYNALNFSLYEMLKPKNIIFEGWKDKRVFNIYKDSSIGKKIIGKKKIDQIGLLHALGVKDISRISGLCDDFNRDFIIITDSDKVAKEKKKNFEKRDKWICYDDLYDIKAITTEDFFLNEFFNKIIKEILYNNKIEIDIILSEELQKDKLNFIKSELEKNAIPPDLIRELLSQLKDDLIKNLKINNIEENYGKVVEQILSKIFI